MRPTRGFFHFSDKLLESRDSVPKHACSLSFSVEVMLDVRLQKQPVFFMATTDRGANEIYARKLALTQIMDSSNTSASSAFYLQADCYEHASHLIVLSGLILVDKKLSAVRSWKYYTSLAICSNVLRSLSKDFFFQFCVLYGPEAGNKHARSLWPKCCSGRWGSVNDTEDRFLRAGAERVRTVLSSLLKKKIDDKEKSKTKEKTLHENDLNPDALALEQMREYAERMTKWKRYAFKCSVDVLWGNLIDLMHWCRRPIMHFTHFVRGSIPEAEIIKHGNQLAQLVGFKAEMIFAEFSALLWPSTGFLTCSPPHV